MVSYRSTMLPGTCENLLVPILERASGKRAGKDFGVCVNPRVPPRRQQCARLPRSSEDSGGPERRP